MTIDVTDEVKTYGMEELAKVKHMNMAFASLYQLGLDMENESFISDFEDDDDDVQDSEPQSEKDSKIKAIPLMKELLEKEMLRIQMEHMKVSNEKKQNEEKEKQKK